jgi:hypothetical protein
MHLRNYVKSCRFYLHFTNKTLGDTFHPLHLLHLSNLLMAGLVFSTLVHNINVLTSVMWVPLDFFHFIVGGWRGLFILDIAPSHG